MNKVTTLYNILKQIKDELKCFDVEIRLGDSISEEEESEYMCLVIYSDVIPEPISIDVNLEEQYLNNLDLDKMIEHLKFELTTVYKQTNSVYYQFGYETVH